MNKHAQVLIKVLLGVLMTGLVIGCSEQRTIWDTNGAYQGREIWNTGGKKLNTPKHFWVNEKGEEILWKKGERSESKTSERNKAL